jgi:hypothetical protein
MRHPANRRRVGEGGLVVQHSGEAQLSSLREVARAKAYPEHDANDEHHHQRKDHAGHEGDKGRAA